MDTDICKIETKLAAARTRLILDKPFLGALVLRLPMEQARADWCPTTATDARKFYYNPEYIDSLSLEQTQFMLAHEALHCALSHFARRGHRLKFRWDQACDYAINPLLIDDGLTPPPDILYMPSFLGMTAEEIYPCLSEKDDDEPLDQHLYDQENRQSGRPPQHSGQQGKGQAADDSDGNGGGNTGEDQTSGTRQEPQPDEDSGGLSPPPPLTPDEAETLNIQWQQRMAGAAQQAMQAGKLGGELARLIDHLLQPQLPWRMLLSKYMSESARDDYSYMRPSRREGDAILPSLRSSEIDIVVVVDTSGSIKDKEINNFLAEINSIKGQIRARITLLACDSVLADGAPWIYEPWDECKLPEQITGGGGTSFVKPFKWVERQGMQPSLLVYFTDAEGEFPATEPAFPTLWLVKGRLKVPWGQRIQLN